MLAQLITRTHTVSELPDDPATWPAQGAWQYEDYLRLPDDGRRYEIIGGALYVANAPSYEHQYTVYKLARLLGDYAEERQLGVVIGATFEVHLDETSKPVQPDILFLRNEQALSPGVQYFTGAPTLIVEVISPSSIRLDRQTKFDAYEQTGVQEYWLVNPKVRSVEVYTLSNGEYALLGQYSGEDQIESNVFVALGINNALLYATVP